MSEMNISLPEFAYLYGKPTSQALLKQQFADFKVFEELPFEFSGDGEHMLVLIEKENTNTTWVAKQLAQFCEVSPKVVSYAGLKDRHAITQQWFSVQLPGQANLELPSQLAEGIRVLKVDRHNRKLKRGALSGNRFEIRLREVSDPEQVLARLEQIRQSGVPNYYGEQRFGRNAGNLYHALQMFQGKRIRDREKRSMYLSAARSLLFNQVISERIQQDCFKQALAGEVFTFATSNAIFCSDDLDEPLRQRFKDGEIELTAPLYGRGELLTAGAVAELEQDIFARYPEYTKGLAKAGLKMERRGLRLMPQALQFEQQGADIVLGFSLAAGCFATSIIRELVTLKVNHDAVN